MTSRFTRMARVAGSALLLAGFVSACSKDDILRPDTPDVITPDKLETPEGQASRYAGAVSDIVFATTGASGLVLFGGLFADELMHSSTPPAVREWDLRGVLSTNSVAVAGTGPFLALQRARTALEGAARALPANDARTGELYALAGLSYVMFGEMFCSGTPISERDPAVALGTPFTTAQLFTRAIERLTTASSNTGGDARIQNLIAVLRGRTLLNQAQYAQAATAVAAVPTSYVYNFIHAAPPARQTNQIQLNTVSDIYSVPDREGINGLPFASAADPRIPLTSTGPSRNDGVTPMVVQKKYPVIDSPVEMATGVEARLIEAEAALQASNVSLWLSKLNEVRATLGDTGTAPNRGPRLPPLADPGTLGGRVDLTFRERAFWMYLTGHRLGDLRRLVRQYGRAEESVYPTGAYHKQGLTRGGQAALVVPQPEENNPNYKASDCTVDTP